MVFYHFSGYLELLQIHSNLQRKLLKFSANLMKFVSWYSPFQKFIPLGFATYWLSFAFQHQWQSTFGKFWFITSVIGVLIFVILQVSCLNLLYYSITRVELKMSTQ